MILENVDRRVLGAVRPVDVTTGLEVREPLVFTAEGVRLVRNRRGYHVIFAAPGLEEHTHAFREPPSAPPLGSIPVVLTVRDPSGRFLPRRQTVSLPQNPDPDIADRPHSLFTPVDVAMFPSPAAPVAAGWDLIRAMVTRQGTDLPLHRALLRVTRVADGEEVRLGLGLSDERGQALVPVAGIPVTTWAEEESEEVIVSEIDVTLQAVFDPALQDIPDPDDLESRRDELPSGTRSLRLAAGREVITSISIALP